MAKGSYSSDVHKATVTSARASGSSMQYATSIKQGVVPAVAHPSLDPKGRNAAGLQIRECRDSKEYPEATPVILNIDITGSNSHAAGVALEKLDLLFGVLQRRGICTDPAIAIVAYGDAFSDKVPLQFSQFESDNAIAEALDNVFPEGAGGGNGGETASLAWYFTNNYVVTDALEKRGRKGYYIMIADERTHDLRKGHIERYIGPCEVSDEQLTAEYLAEELKKKWEVYVLHVNNGVAQFQRAKEQYISLFGEERVIALDNPDNMIEMICVLIGALEDTLAMDTAKKILIESGTSIEVAHATVTAVEGLFTSSGNNSVVKAPDLGL